MISIYWHIDHFYRVIRNQVRIRIQNQTNLFYFVLSRIGMILLLGHVKFRSGQFWLLQFWLKHGVAKQNNIAQDYKNQSKEWQNMIHMTLYIPLFCLFYFSTSRRDFGVDWKEIGWIATHEEKPLQIRTYL